MALQVTKGIVAVLATLTGLTAILDIPLFLFRTSLFPQQYLAVFWGLVTLLTFLTRPASAKVKEPQWYDVVLGGIALGLGLYAAIFYPQIMQTIGLVTPFRAALGALAVLISLESTRRVAGMPLVIIVGFFIFYGRFGYLFPGPLQTTGMSWNRLFNRLFLGTDFLFGSPLRIAVLVVFAFILFGQLLFSTGGGDLFVKLAQALMGKYRGGPAKAAVVASTLFGTISGSAVGNVVSTGMVTIPLMKRTGYSPTFAGAVEAVASTGGGIMPPVMGAAAFVMTEFLNISYSTLAMAALVPALAYYLGLYVQIDLRAARLGLRGLAKEDIPQLGPVLRKASVFLLPIGVLIYGLFVAHLAVAVSALYSCTVIILLSLVRPATRKMWTLTRILQMFQDAVRSMVEITVIGGAAGLVVGLVASTGLGPSLSQVLTTLAGDSLLLLGLMVALASTILGMGMPATASYILLAVLMAPAMVKAGVQPLLAHLFVFYFGNFSFLTPPVAMAAFAGASIAGAPAMATGWQAVRLALVGYIVPFMFLYKPGMALIGSASAITLALFDTVIAAILLGMGVEGYSFRVLRWWERGILFGASILMFVPGWPSRLAGLAIATPMLLWQFRQSEKLAAPALGAPAPAQANSN